MNCGLHATMLHLLPHASKGHEAVQEERSQSEASCQLGRAATIAYSAGEGGAAPPPADTAPQPTRSAQGQSSVHKKGGRAQGTSPRHTHRLCRPPETLFLAALRHLRPAVPAAARCHPHTVPPGPHVHE